MLFRTHELCRDERDLGQQGDTDVALECLDLPLPFGESVLTRGDATVFCPGLKGRGKAGGWWRMTC